MLCLVGEQTELPVHLVDYLLLRLSGVWVKVLVTVLVVLSLPRFLRLRFRLSYRLQLFYLVDLPGGYALALSLEALNGYETFCVYLHVRPCGVGNLYLETKDKGLVATLSGHDPNSDAFNRYWAPNEEVRLEMIEKLERVKEKTPTPNATRQQNNVHSVHPGSILRRQIEAHGYNTRDLAMLIGSTKKLLDGIVAEQEALTMDIAQGLEMVLGVSAAMWMNLQKAYDQAMSV